MRDPMESSENQYLDEMYGEEEAEIATTQKGDTITGRSASESTNETGEK